ncbi:MAG TPA: AAA family ATPase [Candidatus Limnocylindrales bacterium]|nr:AAA family ATPase [Candidatus Limnocylindrales bacterium]
MIHVPVPGLVVLIGAAGAGKTTLAIRLFEPAEILSSDALREALSGDAADQRPTRTAFRILHREARRRLDAGRLVIVDATNVDTRARRSLLEIAAATDAPTLAIVLALAAAEVHLQNARRHGRVVPADIVDRHLDAAATLGADPASIAAALRAGGFASVIVATSAAEVAALRVVRIIGWRPRPVTPLDPEVSALLGQLVPAIQARLGSDLVAVYLCGSAVTGGYDPGISDVDLLVVVEGDPERLDLERLAAMHDAIARRDPAWRDRIETVYVGRSTLQAFRTHPGRLAVISPGEPLHLRDDRASQWVQNWFYARVVSLTLRGPAPDTLIPPIDWSEFVSAITRYADELARRPLADADPGSIAYVVLTMCRAAMTIRVGGLGSKADAAAWAGAMLPDRSELIDMALACRRSGGMIGFQDEGSVTGARTLIAELQTLIRSDPSVSVGDRPPVGVKLPATSG